MKESIKYVTILIFISLINSSFSQESSDITTKLFEVDSLADDFIWCGEGHKIAFMLTQENGIYKTEDRGQHWKKMNDLFTNLGRESLEDGDKEIGKISQMIQSPVDPSLIFLLGTKGINWIATNCGEKIQALNSGRKIHEYIPHPTERTWGLASAFSLCEDFQDEPCKIFKEVYVTKDLGVNWDQIGSYVTQFDWGIVTKKQIEKGVPKERILMSYEPKGIGDQKLQGWNYKIDFFYSDDFFKTSHLAVTKGNQFFLTDHYLFVAVVADQAKGETLLYGAKSNRLEYEFSLIETGSSSLTENSYTFLDPTFHSVFLHINHFGPNSRYGHVYTSGPKGLKYNLSLKNIVKSNDDQCDFEKVISVEGVYVANVISKKYLAIAEKQYDQKTNKDNRSKSKSGSHQAGDVNFNDFIKTKITFNRGGDWQRIKAPEVDSYGKKIKCGEYCYLNLFGLSSKYPSFYSVENAAGIIIGNGNIGRYLGRDVNTYLSRDGGLTWFEVQKRSHIYEIGDDGGLILLAEDQNPTNIIYYSYDEGLTWNTIKISDERYMIKNIVMEPSSASHDFFVYGETTKGGKKKGVVIAVDFAEHFPQCRNPANPGTENSDYEIWSPSDGRAGESCLLGHKIEIVRKKREAKCINTEKFERKIKKFNCQCTEKDYQCDLGYERSEDGEPCLKQEEGLLSEQVIKPPANCKGTYKVSRGYRKIPGNTCKGGVDYAPLVLKCPTESIFSAQTMIIFILILIIIAIIGYILVDRKANLICEFDLSGISNLVSKFKESFDKPGQYDTIHYIGDNNSLFEEDDDKIINPKIVKKKKKQEVPEEKKDKEVAQDSEDKNKEIPIDNKKNNNTNLISFDTNEQTPINPL